MSPVEEERQQRQQYERIATREAEVIEGLSSLCRDLISRMAHYTDMTAEQHRLECIMDLHKGEDQ